MRRVLVMFALLFVALAATNNLGRVKTAIEYLDLVVLKRPAVLLLIAALVGWVLGFLVGRFRKQSRTHAFQNSSEARLTQALKTRFSGPDYHLMNHITLRLKDGTTQIDHILVSRFGIFVIETKDYKGWIYANPQDRYWTQVLYRVKFRFQNPIHQNYMHVSVVRGLLDFLPAEVIQSIVVFTGQAVFRTDVPSGVFGLNDALDFIAEQSTEIVSLNRLQFCVGRLETTRLAVTTETDIEHIQRLRRRFGGDEESY